MFLLILFSVTSNAQDNRGKPQVWATAGFGGSSGSVQGIGGVVQVSLKEKRSIIGFAYRGDAEVTLWGSARSGSAISLSYGRSLKLKQYFFQLEAGPSLIDLSVSEFDQHRSLAVAGLTVVGRVSALSTKHVGVGLELFSNFRSNHNFYGLNLLFHFGNLPH